MIINDFFGSIYELFGLLYLDQFSLDMFSFNLYSSVGILATATTLGLLTLYYYPNGFVPFSTPRHWFIWLVSIVLLNVVVSWIWIWITFDAKGISHSVVDYFVFEVINGFWVLFFGFIYSMAIKRWSTNCSTIPFKKNSK